MSWGIPREDPGFPLSLRWHAAKVSMTSKPVSNILLVEDNDEDAEWCMRVLRDLEPSAALTRTHDGAEALDFIFREGAFLGRQRGLPDLILLDLHMARVGGIDVLQTLKSDELTRDIPVVILTGSADGQMELMSAQMGSAGYLNKPVAAENLRRFLPTRRS
jgi:two-component system response regulator